jgi:hypothetical protein
VGLNSRRNPSFSCAGSILRYHWACMPGRKELLDTVVARGHKTLQAPKPPFQTRHLVCILICRVVAKV